jgi:hypothetical protein
MTRPTTHATLRLSERYGLDANAAVEIAEMIRKRRDARNVKPQLRGRSVWRVRYHDKSVLVVYDHRLKKVLTALPSGATGSQKRRDPE